MEQFLSEIEVYASRAAVSPSTVVQKAAQVSGQTWARWRSGNASPTARTMDRIRGYMRDNPIAASPAGARA